MAPLSPCHPEPLLPFGIPNLFSRLEFRASSPAVIPSAERDLQLGKWRETVANSKRFLVAGAPRNDKKEALLGMTEKGRSPEWHHFPCVIPSLFFRCHPERSEGSAVGKVAGDGGRLEEIPRRCTPRSE